ncbi:MAG: hypothetical protein Ct9H300mP1_14150 [Planctomycetaceae bacterium]|nr:MAG: hypothetical protein Ct9H300mP1_14150 [Planctomycetaceae bacterium]
MPKDEQRVAVVPDRNRGLFHFRENELETAGFKSSIQGELRLPVGLATPLDSVRFSDGRVAVWCGLPEPRKWILNTVGTIEQEIDLQKEPLEGPPVLTEGGIVAPLPGRLKLVARGAGQGPAVNSRPRRGGKKRKWEKTVGIDASTCWYSMAGENLVGSSTDGSRATPLPRSARPKLKPRSTGPAGVPGPRGAGDIRSQVSNCSVPPICRWSPMSICLLPPLPDRGFGRKTGAGRDRPEPAGVS